MMTHVHKGIEYSIFFVLNSLFNGERGTFAAYAEGEGDGNLDDGWYYTFDDLSPALEMPAGPYPSRDDAVDGAKEYIDNHEANTMEEKLNANMEDLNQAISQFNKAAATVVALFNREKESK